MLIPFLFSIPFMELMNILSDFNNPKTISVLKFLQLNQAIGLFILPALTFSYFYSNNFKEFLQLNRPKNKNFFYLGIFGLFVISPFVSYTSQINQSLHLPQSLASLESWMKAAEADASKVTELFLNVNSISGLILNLLIIALAAAIGEEFFFRGILQNLIFKASKNVHFSVWFIAIIFSAFHGQFYGFLPRMFLGAFLGYAYIYSGSIWVAVAIHFVNNGTAVLADYLHRNKFITFNLDDSIPVPFYLAIVSLALGTLVFQWMRKNYYLSN